MEAVPETLAELPLLKMALAWLALANLHTFTAFWFDKRAACAATGARLKQPCLWGRCLVARPARSSRGGSSGTRRASSLLSVGFGPLHSCRSWPLAARRDGMRAA